jgi:hypothetical protein
MSLHGTKIRKNISFLFELNIELSYSCHFQVGVMFLVLYFKKMLFCWWLHMYHPQLWHLITIFYISFGKCPLEFCHIMCHAIRDCCSKLFYWYRPIREYVVFYLLVSLKKSVHCEQSDLHVMLHFLSFYHVFLIKIDSPDLLKSLNSCVCLCVQEKKFPASQDQAAESFCSKLFLRC